MDNNDKNSPNIYTNKILDAMVENNLTHARAPYYWTNHEKYSRIIWLTENKFHSHDFWEMFIVLKGTSIHHTQNKTETLSSGSLYLLPPSCKHYIEIPHKDDKNKETYIHRDFISLMKKCKKFATDLTPIYILNFITLKNRYPQIFP